MGAKALVISQMIFFITAPLFGGSMGLSLATAAAGLNPPMVVVLDASPPFERPLFPPWFIPPSPTSKREGTWRYLYDQNISLVSDLLAIKGKCERYKRHGFYLFSLLLLLNDYLIYLLWGINNNLYDVFSFQKKNSKNNKKSIFLMHWKGIPARARVWSGAPSCFKIYI